MKKEIHIPFMLLGIPTIKKLRRFKAYGAYLAKFNKRIDELLARSGIPLKGEEYCTGALFSFLIYTFLFGGLLFALSNTFNGDLIIALRQGIGLGIAVGFLFFFLILNYPKNMVRKKADLVDRYLMFALKDFLMQIQAGHSTYNAFVEISHADYGQVSIEFENCAKRIQTGMAVEHALEIMAQENESKYLKKVIWQLVNTIKAGASLKESLTSIINDLHDTQKNKIINFANELNLWSLIYMLFAVAIPSIGTTMMVILSAFGGANLTPAFFVMFTLFCGFVQVGIVGFIKARRPVVE